MSGINYSQCWEDESLLKRALKITSDDTVLSITSGGDNTLALLLQNPKKIFSIDINPTQNYLAELKLQSVKALTYEQYLKFLGVRNSHKRVDYYKQVSDTLSEKACLWFFDNINIIEGGVIHSGKFERYLNSFRKYILPLVHSKRTILQFVNQNNVQDQIDFYEDVWDTWRWRFFFGIATNSSLLRKYARQTGAVAHQTDSGYMQQLEELIHRNLLNKNYYLRYALLGEYGKSLPDYLQKKNYPKLGDSSEKCEFKNENLLSFLQDAPDKSLTKFNLSDVFDFLTTEQANKIWKEIIRTAKKDAIVAYWCHQIEHVPPLETKERVRQNTTLETRLKKLDKLYLYRSFHIYTIKK